MASPSATAARAASESFYDWTAPDQPISVSISLSLIDLLSIEMIEAFKSIPKRGLEIGGLLLGHIDTSGNQPVVVIEDRELAPSEHVHGPSFLLSSQDRDQLTALAAKWGAESNAGLQVVGLFRGDTRPEHKFDEQDIALAKELAARGQGVFLLIAPAAGHIGQATIGILKDGELAPVHEFPFRSAALREGGFPIHDGYLSAIAAERHAPAPVPAASAVPGEHRAPRATLKGPRALDLAAYRRRSQSINWRALWRRSREWAWIPLSVAAILSGVLFATLWNHRAARPDATLPAVAAGRPAAPSLTPIQLSVRREGPDWNLTWNHTAELIAQAERGALQIHDGAASWELPLDRNELRTGSIRYLPKSREVKFQLQVFSPNRSASESIIALDPGYQAEKKEPKKEADQGLTQQRSRKEARETEHRQAHPVLAAARPAPALGHDVVSLPDPPPLPSSQVVPQAPALLPRGRSPEMRLTVTTAFEPAAPSRLRKALKFVSPARLVRRHEAVEVQATPLREVKPVAPLQPGWHGPAEVEVRVAIDAQGKVFGAWVESPRESDSLSDAALSAARNWRFRPATKNHATVESEAILRFRFQNPDVAAVNP